jgi:putative hydrolase of the HAD superfamily
MDLRSSGQGEFFMESAVIFDWGGVLMRTGNYEPRHYWDRLLGLPIGSVESIVHGSKAWWQVQQGEISTNDYWTIIAGHLQLSPVQLADFRRDFYSGDRLDEALLSLIANLRTRGILVGLLSNNSLELLDLLNDKQLTPLFDGIVISAQIGIMKPNPDSYTAILRQFGLAPAQALFIDDSLENVEGALALGMGAIRFVPGIELTVGIENWLTNNCLPSTADFAP